MRVAILIFVLGVIFTGVAWAFWTQELKYLQPTPVPVGFVTMRINEEINLESWIQRDSTKALFIHFFNPYCPCSKFNTPYFESLARNYAKQVQFVVVVPEDISSEEAQSFLGQDLKIIQDKNGVLAMAAGVYSSPQAVIIDTFGLLYYRGNYNKSRYCTAKETNYAEIALNQLLNNQPIPPTFDQYASTPYGCLLPAFEKFSPKSL